MKAFLLKCKKILRRKRVAFKRHISFAFVCPRFDGQTLCILAEFEDRTRL